MPGFNGSRGGRGKFGGERRSFGGGGHRGFGGGRSGGKSFGGRGDRPTERHHAICSQCGEDCTVPFKPLGDKPVLCDKCFKSGEGERPDFKRQKRSVPGAFGQKPEVGSAVPNYKTELSELSAKLDRIVFLLEKLLPPAPEAAPAPKRSAVKKTTSRKKA